MISITRNKVGGQIEFTRSVISVESETKPRFVIREIRNFTIIITRVSYSTVIFHIETWDLFEKKEHFEIIISINKKKKKSKNTREYDKINLMFFVKYPCKYFTTIFFVVPLRVKKIIVEEYFKQNKKLRIVSNVFGLFQNLIHVA